jgi:hypothetical protein
MKMVIHTALVSGVLLISIASFRAQSSGDTVAVITKLENDGIKADVAADPSWAEMVLADDWTGCDDEGKWFSKADALETIADTKNNRFNSETLTDLKVRVYGNSVVATYKDTYDALVNGQHRVRTDQVTDVWVKMGSGWKLVNSQGTAAQ